MDTLNLLKVFSSQLSEFGLPGIIIVMLLGTEITLIKAYLLCQKRCDTLVDKMFEMSKETNIMIERITGR